MLKRFGLFGACCVFSAGALVAQEGSNSTVDGFLSEAAKAALLQEASEQEIQIDTPLEQSLETAQERAVLSEVGDETARALPEDSAASASAVESDKFQDSTGLKLEAVQSASAPSIVPSAETETATAGHNASKIDVSAETPVKPALEVVLQAPQSNPTPTALPRPVPGQFLARAQAESMRDAANVVAHREGVVSPGAGVRLEVVYGQSYPVVVCKIELTCLVELEDGEEMLDAPLLSDPVRWEIAVRIMDGGVFKTYLALKARPDAGEASLSLFTNRRSYYILLHPDTALHTPVLAFHYPDTEQRKIEERLAEVKAKRASEAEDKKAAKRAAASKRAAKVAKSGVSTTGGAVPADELDFEYRLTGRTAFKPVRVYTDGKRTYVDLPQGYRGELPTLIVTSGNANNTVNIAVKKDGRQLVADKALDAFTLVAGNSKVHVKKGR